MEGTLEESGGSSWQRSRHLPVVTALWVRRFGQVLLTGVLLAGLSMPMPGYDVWGLLLLGGMVVWLIWLLERLVWRHGQLPGNWIHLGLLGPAMIFAGHVLLGRFLGGNSGHLNDGISSSLMTHAGLLSLLVVLIQSFCSARKPALLISSFVGLAMVAAGMVGLLRDGLEPLRGALWLTGLAGVGVWLWPAAGVFAAAPLTRRDLQRPLHIARLATGAFAGMGMLVLAPSLTMLILAAGIVAVVIVVAVLRRRSSRLATLLAGLILLAGGVALCNAHFTSPTWLGQGDAGFVHAQGKDSGFAVLAATTGWIGAGVMYLSAGGFAAWMLLRSPKEQRNHCATPLVVMTTLLATAGLLINGGYVSPTMGLAAAFCWGLAPMGTAFRGRPRGAWIMAGVVLVTMLAINVASDPGLLMRASLGVGISDKSMHLMAGFVLAMVLAWWLGSWRWWAGLGMLVVAGLAGPAGEYIQKIYTDRSVDELDAWSHIKGVALAAGLYLICVAARWSEVSEKQTKPWKTQTLRTFLNAFLRLGLVGLLVLLISGWFLVAGIVRLERLNRPAAWMVMTDGIAAALDKPLYMLGTASDRQFITTDTIRTILPNGKLAGVWTSTKRDWVRVFAISPEGLDVGRNRFAVIGRPLGPFTYERHEFTWAGAGPGQHVSVITAETFSTLQQNDPEALSGLIDVLEKRGPIACLHVGGVPDYLVFRQMLQEQSPAIRCINYLATPQGPLARPLNMLRANLTRPETTPPMPPMDFITTNLPEALLAKKYLRHNLTIRLLGDPAIAPPPTLEKQLRTYPSLDMLIEAVTAETQSADSQEE
jgi:hypothetical protein